MMGGAQAVMGAGDRDTCTGADEVTDATEVTGAVAWYHWPLRKFFPSCCTMRSMLQLCSSCHVPARMEYVMQQSTRIEGVKSSTNYQSCASLPVLSLSDIFLSSCRFKLLTCGLSQCWAFYDTSVHPCGPLGWV